MSQQRKIERLSEVPDAFAAKVAQSQSSIFSEIVATLNQLDMDGDSIAMSAKNINLLQAIRNRLKQILESSDYAKAVASFRLEMDKQQALNNKLFQELGYSQSAATAALLSASKSTTIELLIGGALDANFYNPVIAEVETAISNGAGFAETVRSIRMVVEGGTNGTGAAVEGKLLRYSKQIAKDSFSIFDSTHNQQVTSDLGLQFYRYTGGTISDTRKFCSARNGKYFHKKEIESWATNSGDYEGNPYPRGKWDGMYRSTNSSNIFSYRGGYNCNHTLIPVPASGVPLDVLRRNVSNGNFSPTPAEKDILGI